MTNFKAKAERLKDSDDERAWRLGISARSLMETEFPPLRYVVQDYVAEGLTLFAGAPKIGKSWWALNVAVAVASNVSAFGGVATEHGDVLYLALEDNQRRLQARLKTMGLVEAPSMLTLCTRWPPLSEGAVREVENWANDVPSPTLVIVDVLTKIRDASGGKEANYESDYKTLAGLQEIAGLRGIAILAIHHTRKMDAEDPFDCVSGSRGLTGAADTVLVLKRNPGDRRTVLYGRGRDIPEIETALEFTPDKGTWTVLGAASEQGRTTEREEIIAILRNEGKAISAQSVASQLNKEAESVRRTLNRMARDGEIEKPSRGSYRCLNCPIV